MANRRTKGDWENLYSSKTWGGVLSGMVAGASAGSSIGGMAGGVFAGVGAALGAGVGSIVGFYKGRNDFLSDIRNYISNEKLSLKTSSVNRNQDIITTRQGIQSFRQSFDATYGNGMYEQYNSVLAKSLGYDKNANLSQFLENMELSKVVGEIKNSAKDFMNRYGNLFENTLDMNKVGSDYVSYLQEQLRAQDTAFGLQMQQLAVNDQQTFAQYKNDMLSSNMQFLKTLNDTFAEYEKTNVSNEVSMARSALSQAVSGIRQTDSGRALSNMQRFENDLATAAIVGTIDYYLKSYEMNAKAQTDNLLINAWNTRSQISASSKQALDSLVASYNQQHQKNTEIGMIHANREIEMEDTKENINDAIYKENEKNYGWDRDVSYEAEVMDTYVG